MGINSLSDGIKTSAVIAGVGTAGVLVGSGLGFLAASRKGKRRKRRSRRIVRKRRSRNKKMRKRYTPHTAGKRKDRSHKRIRYTKRGQPYVIMSSGRARFISMSSAKRSHRQKGGRY